MCAAYRTTLSHIKRWQSRIFSEEQPLKSSSLARLTMEESHPTGRKPSFTNGEKLRVVEAFLAQNLSMRKYASMRGVSASNLSKWCSEVDAIRAAPPDKKSLPRRSNLTTSANPCKYMCAIAELKSGLLMQSNASAKCSTNDQEQLELAEGSGTSKSRQCKAAAQQANLQRHKRKSHAGERARDGLKRHGVLPYAVEKRILRAVTTEVARYYMQRFGGEIEENDDSHSENEA